MSTATQFTKLRRTVHSIDGRFEWFKQCYALGCLRYSLAIVFFWFGIIKPLGITPATMLVSETLSHTPILRAFVPFWVFMPVLGYWEAFVGLALLSRRTIKLAAAFMMAQMAATFVPLVVVPDITFHTAPFVPTTPGFYIVKNFVLLTSGLVVASHYTDTGYQNEALRLLRGGLCVVFLWAGALTLLGTGEMAGWVVTTIQSPSPGMVVAGIGVLKLAIGAGLLTKRTTSIAAYLVTVYLLLSLLPLLLRPDLVTVTSPVHLAFPGVFLIKDWILVSAVLVLDYRASDASWQGSPPSSVRS